MSFPIVAAINILSTWGIFELLISLLCINSSFRTLSVGAMHLRRATKISNGISQLNVYGRKVRDIVSCINKHNEASTASFRSYKVSWCYNHIAKASIRLFHRP
jgi:hypothetical protein